MKTKHRISVGYYVVYNVYVTAENEEEAMAIADDIYCEQGLEALTKLGKKVSIDDSDHLIQYEEELT